MTKSLLFWKLYSISKATMAQSKQQKKKPKIQLDGWRQRPNREIWIWSFFDLLEFLVGSKPMDKHGIEICSVDGVQGLIPEQLGGQWKRSWLDFRRYNNSNREDRQCKPTSRITAPEKSAAQCWCAKHLCGNSFQIWLMRLPESSVQGLSLDCLKACFLLGLQSCNSYWREANSIKVKYFFFFLQSRFPRFCEQISPCLQSLSSDSATNSRGAHFVPWD